MAVTSGFFNSVDHDRMYNAEDVGSLLDGIISDGILNSYGSHFLVTHTTGLDITVGDGRGWFKQTWIKNDDNVTLTANPNTSGARRIDTVVIDVDKRDDVRANNILIVQGTSSRPVLIDEAAHKQYPIADLYIDATGADIEQVIDRRSEIYAGSPLMGTMWFPIGGIYMSVDNREPSLLFGGTWELISGRFLIGCGGTSGISGGEEGGSWTHTLNVNQLPSHNHSISLTTSAASAVIRMHPLGTDYSTNTNVMQWAQATNGLDNIEIHNYLPSAWNYPVSYQGCGTVAPEQAPPLAPAAYETTQTEIYQEPHSHGVSGNTASTGAGQPIEVKPPYLAVYIWKRVS